MASAILSRQAEELKLTCRFALEVMANVHLARSEAKQAVAVYEKLQEVDKVRRDYWGWKVDCLLATAEAERGVGEVPTAASGSPVGLKGGGGGYAAAGETGSGAKGGPPAK